MYHESETINHTLEQLLAISGDEPPEIVVVDGDPEGSTNHIIRHELRSRMSLLTTNPGRAIQMNRGAERAKGAILLFLHVDTLLPPSAFMEILSVMSDPSVTAGAFSLGIITHNPLIKLIARLTTLRSHLTRTPYGDQAIFMPKEIL